MAKLSFLHIGKANARISELEAQLETLTKERDEAVTALEANAGEVSSTAEQIQTELVAANAKTSKLEADLKAAQDASAAKDKQIIDLQSQLAAKSEEVKVSVARQAVEVQAALGQPAAPVIPDSAKSKEELKGMDRVRAGIKSAIDKDIPISRTN